MDDKSPLKWAWLRSHDPFSILRAASIAGMPETSQHVNAPTIMFCYFSFTRSFIVHFQILCSQVRRR